MSKPENKQVTGIKGFDENMQCRGFQFEIGKTYEHTGTISVCASGFHFCENPLDTLKYYGPAKSKYAEVEGENCSPHHEDSKFVCGKITVKASVSLSTIISGSVRWLLAKVKATTGNSAHAATTGNSAHAATTGNYAHAATTGDSAHAATTGDSAHAATTGYSAHAATTGYSAHAATTGDSAHAATTGNSAHAATTGNSAHAATTGNYAHAATTGDSAHAATTGNSAHAATTGYSAHAATTGYSAHAATTGYSAHAATTGYSAHAATTGYSAHAATTGENAIACAIGFKSRVKSAKGNWLVLSEYDENGKVLFVKSALVDGRKIKADTWYELKGGKFVVVKENE
jgi:hypothetical protein